MRQVYEGQASKGSQVPSHVSHRNYSGASRTAFQGRPESVRLQPGILFGFSPKCCSASPEYAGTPKIAQANLGCDCFALLNPSRSYVMPACRRASASTTSASALRRSFVHQGAITNSANAPTAKLIHITHTTAPVARWSEAMHRTPTPQPMSIPAQPMKLHCLRPDRASSTRVLASMNTSQTYLKFLVPWGQGNDTCGFFPLRPFLPFALFPTVPSPC